VSFIFVGSTGVGKTELVKQLAADLFDSPESLIRLDMSEFMEKHSPSPASSVRLPAMWATTRPAS
jgi:ATP-dependent Clp protease ATP-binding subunit ClpB